MTTNRTELEQQMINRVRKHMLTSLGGIALAIVTIGVLGGVVRSAMGKTPLIAIAPILGIVMIPAIGFWSTYRNLRCPSCNALVAWQVSWQYSLFSASASKHCNGCNQKIFADDIGRRFTRMIVILVAFFMGLGFLGAILANTVKPAPRPPPAATSPAP